jgi:hypothetical protein
MKLRALLAAALLAGTAAAAAPHQFVNGETVTLEPDQGYVLVRMMQRPGGLLRGTVKYAPVLIRVLSAEEMEKANAAAKADPSGWKDKIESNVAEPLADHPYAEADNRAVLLAPLKPGTYVFAGVALTNWASGSGGVMTTSLCMGTVSFEVKPGVVTDMGFILGARDDEPTTIPELAKVVAGKRTGFSTLVDDVAIRPASPALETPEKLRALPIVPADYRAVGAYPNFIGAPIGRLAPLEGVLEYDADGQAIDVKAARTR